jgi:hypothetical protein
MVLVVSMLQNNASRKVADAKVPPSYDLGDTKIGSIPLPLPPNLGGRWG